jgi:hypothetical protein
MKNIYIIILITLGALKGYSQNNIQYEYDEVQRLSKATYSNGVVIQYTYDELGNRMSKVVNNSCQAATATISGTQTILIGQSANLTITLQGQMPFSFVFNGQTYSNINSNTATILVTPTQTNTYTLASVSNACGVGTVSGQAVITVTVPCTTVAPPVLQGSSLNTFSGQNGTFYASGCNGTYSWYNAVSGGTLLGTGSSISVPAINQTTTYYASCTYNGCESNRANATIVVDNTCNFSINGNTMATGGCGQNTNSATIVAAGNSTYTYLWNDGSTLSQRSDLNTGSYIVNVTDANGCMKSQAINVDAYGYAFWDGEVTGLNAINMGIRSAVANGKFICQDATNLGIIKELNIANGQINTINLTTGLSPTGYWTIMSNQNGASTSDDKLAFLPFQTGNYRVVVSNSNYQNFANFYSGNLPLDAVISSTTGSKIFALQNGVIKAFDINGNLLASYTLPTTNTVYNHDCIVDDGTNVMVYNGRYIYVFDENLTYLRQIGADYGITNIYARKGKIYVSYVQNGLMGIYNIATGTRIRNIGGLSGTAGTSIGIGITDDFAFIPVNTNYVDVVDLLNFAKILTLDAGSFIGGLHYDPVSKRVVVLLGNKVKYIKVAKNILSVLGTVTNTTLGNALGAISLNVVGGTATYSWSNGATTKDISNLTAGIYTVTITPSDGSCPLKRIFQVNASTVPSAPTVSSNKSSICKGENVTLTATNCSGTITWNNNFGTGSSITVSPTVNTQYTAICTVAGLSSSNSNIASVAVNDIPSAPSISSLNIISGQSTTLTASNCTGTITWYDATTNGTQLGTGASYNTPALTTTTTYYASCSVNSCVSSTRGSGIVTVSACNVSVPTAINSSNCGVGSVVLSASGCSNGTYHWYSTASGGTSLSSIASYTTPSISTTTNYYVDCTVGTCTSGRTMVTATINVIPSAPTVSSATIDSGQSTTLTVTNCTGNITWYDAASGGTVLGYGSNYSTQTLSTTKSYYASCTVNNCVSTRGSGAVTVNVCNITAPIPMGANRCGTGTLSLSATGCSGTYNWYSAASGGTSLSSIASYTTPSLTTTTNYYIDCTVGTCTSGRAMVTATINTIPSAPTISSTTVNSGQTASLTATNCTGTISWYNGVTGGTSLATGNSYTTPVLTTTTTYYAECSVNGCVSTSRGSGVVTINTTCSNMYTLRTGNWNDITVWSCNRIPISTDIVTIKPSHFITIPATYTANAKSVIFEAGGKIIEAANTSKLCLSCPTTIPINGLMLYLPFNGNANDASGNNNNGVVTGATLGNDRFGIANKAYRFNDGNNITVANSASLSLTNAFSVSVWVNMQSTTGRDGNGAITTNSEQCIFTKNCDGGQLRSAIFPQTNGTFLLQTWANTGDQISIPFQLNQWKLISLTYDGNTLKQFVDGNLVSTKAVVLSLALSNNYNLVIGNMGCWLYYFNGFMDDFRMYNRSLSNLEVMDIYNAEKP